MLRDSLGLTEEDRVFRVEVSSEENQEVATPEVVRIPVGAWVEFLVVDHRVHTVNFELSQLPVAQAEYLTKARQDASPPLVSSGTRFVVTFSDAPPGSYPYVLEGSGRAGRGIVIVELETAG